MENTQQKTIVNPHMTDILTILKQDIFATLNCVKIGEIKSFDALAKTAQVQILFKQTASDGTISSYPLLLDCPVFTLQGGGGSIQFPIAEGDQCLILFSDRRLDEWLQNGTEAAPASVRMHDFSDAIVLVGMNALNSDLPDYPADKVSIAYQGSSVELSPTGAKVISSGGAEIDLDTLVGVKNNAISLATLMTNFISLLETLQVLDPVGPTDLPLTAASIAALEAFKAQFALLLE